MKSKQFTALALTLSIGTQIPTPFLLERASAQTGTPPTRILPALESSDDSRGPTNNSGAGSRAPVVANDSTARTIQSIRASIVRATSLIAGPRPNFALASETLKSAIERLNDLSLDQSREAAELRISLNSALTAIERLKPRPVQFSASGSNAQRPSAGSSGELSSGGASIAGSPGGPVGSASEIESLSASAISDAQWEEALRKVPELQESLWYLSRAEVRTQADPQRLNQTFRELYQNDIATHDRELQRVQLLADQPWLFGQVVEWLARDNETGMAKSSAENNILIKENPGIPIDELADKVVVRFVKTGIPAGVVTGVLAAAPQASVGTGLAAGTAGAFAGMVIHTKLVEQLTNLYGLRVSKVELETMTAAIFTVVRSAVTPFLVKLMADRAGFLNNASLTNRFDVSTEAHIQAVNAAINNEIRAETLNAADKVGGSQATAPLWRRIATSVLEATARISSRLADAAANRLNDGIPGPNTQGVGPIAGPGNGNRGNNPGGQVGPLNRPIAGPGAMIPPNAQPGAGVGFPGGQPQGPAIIGSPVGNDPFLTNQGQTPPGQVLPPNGGQAGNPGAGGSSPGGARPPQAGPNPIGPSGPGWNNQPGWTNQPPPPRPRISIPPLHAAIYGVLGGGIAAVELYLLGYVAKRVLSNLRQQLIIQRNEALNNHLSSASFGEGLIKLLIAARSSPEERNREVRFDNPRGASNQRPLEVMKLGEKEQDFILNVVRSAKICSPHDLRKLRELNDTEQSGLSNALSAQQKRLIRADYEQRRKRLMYACYSSGNMRAPEGPWKRVSEELRSGQGIQSREIVSLRSLDAVFRIMIGELVLQMQMLDGDRSPSEREFFESTVRPTLGLDGLEMYYSGLESFISKRGMLRDSSSITGYVIHSSPIAVPFNFSSGYTSANSPPVPNQ